MPEQKSQFWIFTIFCILRGLTAIYQDNAKASVDIRAVDQQICEILKKPTPANYKERDTILKNLQIYYKYLDNINDRIDRRWREAENVKKLLQAIGKEGPQMVNFPVNGTEFKQAYEWDDDDIDTLTTTILGIKYMWDKVTKRSNFLNSEK